MTTPVAHPDKNKSRYAFRRALPMALAVLLIPALLAWVYLGTSIPERVKIAWYKHQFWAATDTATKQNAIVHIWCAGAMGQRWVLDAYIDESIYDHIGQDLDEFEEVEEPEMQVVYRSNKGGYPGINLADGVYAITFRAEHFSSDPFGLRGKDTAAMQKLIMKRLAASSNYVRRYDKLREFTAEYMELESAFDTLVHKDATTVDRRFSHLYLTKYEGFSLNFDLSILISQQPEHIQDTLRLWKAEQYSDSRWEEEDVLNLQMGWSLAMGIKATDVPVPSAAKTYPLDKELYAIYAQAYRATYLRHANAKDSFVSYGCGSLASPSKHDQEKLAARRAGSRDGQSDANRTRRDPSQIRKVLRQRAAARVVELRKKIAAVTAK